MQSHTDAVRCLCLDGNLVLSGSYDASIRVHALATGICVQTLRGHQGAVLSLACNTGCLASGGLDGTIRLWDRERGVCQRVLHGHNSGVTCLYLDTARQQLFSGGFEGNLVFWDLVQGRETYVLDWARHEGHRGVIRCLAADARRIVTGSDDKTIKIWDRERGCRLATLQCVGHEVLERLRSDAKMRKGSSLLGTGSWASSKTTWRMDTARPFLFFFLSCLRHHSSGAACVQISDTKLVSGSFDETIKLLDFGAV